MYDYHTHSSFSDDCSTPMKEMLDAACKIGIREIAITDHYDPDYPDLDYPFELDFPRYHKALTDAKEAYRNKIKILKGVEIGIQHGTTLEKCKERANEFDYDFIIGSFHCAQGYELYGSRYFADRSAEESYVAYYTYVCDCLLQYKDYDVIGHINLIDRYSDRIPAASCYMDLMEEILKIIIADGKGIEINTSSSRYGMGERTTPAREILHRFAELGGEIVTIGSDAHRTRDLGYRYDFAVEMIKSAGLKYLTTFDQRKPVFVKL